MNTITIEHPPAGDAARRFAAAIAHEARLILEHPDNILSPAAVTSLRWMRALAAPRAEITAAGPLADHMIRDLVNTLHDIAVVHHASDSLRDRIARVVVPALTTPPTLAGMQPQDERAAFEAWYCEAAQRAGVEIYSVADSRTGDGYAPRHLDGQWRGWLGHAAQAAAPAPQAVPDAQPVAYLIDWPDEPELGHYFAEAPTDTGRCRALVFRDADPQPAAQPLESVLIDGVQYDVAPAVACELLRLNMEIVSAAQPSGQAQSEDDARADLFWDDDDPERAESSVHNVIVEAVSNRGVQLGDTIEVQRAIRLPNIIVRITGMEDEEGNGELEFEVVDAARAQQQGGSA